MPNVSEDNACDASRRKNGIFFVTDLMYALPTIAAALEIRKKIPRLKADVRIVTSDIPSEMIARVRNYVEKNDIHVDTMSSSLFSKFDKTLYNKTHVPVSALGRFFMLDCVPDIYDRVLYLDGDTWSIGDALTLLEAALPKGKFAAAEDKSYYYQAEIGRTGKRVRNYFKNIGISGEKGYFNSGVILAHSDTWRTLCRDAFDFFLKNTANCMFHDQSALNAVAGSRRIRLAPRWNYLQSYYDWGVRPNQPPEILHFAGGGKPWLAPDHEFFDLYRQAFLPLNNLGIAIQPWSRAQLLDHSNFVFKEKLKSLTLFRHRIYTRRRIFDWLTNHAAIK